MSSLSGTYATFETYANDGPEHLGFAQNALHRYRLTFMTDHQSHEARERIFWSRKEVFFQDTEVLGSGHFFENPTKMCLIWGEGRYIQKNHPQKNGL